MSELSEETSVAPCVQINEEASGYTFMLMSDKTSGPSSHGDSEIGGHLLSLPVEIIIKMLEYLDAKFVAGTVSLVCKELHRIIMDESTWRCRIARRFPKPYPPRPLYGDSSWMSACIAREDNFRKWTQQDSHMGSVTINVSYASLDAVHFAQDGDVLAAGCRDHQLVAYDTGKLSSGADPKKSLLFSTDSHKGWVWSISSCEGLLCSSSWDGHVMTWDLTASGRRLHDYSCKNAILCTSFSGSEILAGSYDRCIYCLDLRLPQDVQKFRHHNRPVLCIASDSEWVISGSEDGTIVVTDRRNTQAYKKVKVNNYPTCFSYDGHLLYTGCRDGSIELFQFVNGELQHTETFQKDCCHSRQVTSVCHATGSVFSSSKDKTCKVWEPSLQAGVIASIECGSEIAKMHSSKGMLGLACCDGSLHFYYPRLC